MQNLSPGIIGVGSYIPERVVTNDDLKQFVDTNDEWIRTRTGIRERRFARADEYTSDMALAALKKALARAEIDAKKLDYILVATASPDNTFPNTACWVQKGLGLEGVACLDVSTACSGFVYALQLATALVASGQNKCVAVIGAEKLSAITNFQDRGSCILFADGAGAAVVTMTQGRGTIICSNTGALFDYDALAVPAGGCRLPASRETVEKNQHTIAMNGRATYQTAVRKFVEMANEACTRGGIKISDLNIVIPHQANEHIVYSAMDRAGVPRERVILNIDRVGNTSSASIPIAFDEAVGDGRIKRGDYILLMGFGGGLSWGYNLIKW
ncbi:MAG: ketoacyl-ACP synthase III [Planctomycetes bacterium]|nr:ketoacyl-ACP synthase III [Planctomycetota bacterium]